MRNFPGKELSEGEGRRGWLRPIAAGCIAGLGLLAGGLILAVAALDPVNEEEASATGMVTAQVDQRVLNDEWSDRISKDSYWRGARGGSGGNSGSGTRNKRQRPSQLQGPPPAPNWFATPPPPNTWMPNGNQPASTGGRSSGGSGGATPPPRQGGGYRTVCVRLCDGFFFPISFGTHEGNFNRDQAACTNACPGARLYHYKVNEEPEDMVDATGQSYARLKNANLFRTQYVESCKCRPHPWEEASTDRHRVYVLEEQRRRGNRAVVAELESLKAKARQDTRKYDRRRPADRRRLPATEDAANQQTPASEIAQSTAPRSDASRGQSAERTPGIVTGSIATAASAVTVQSVTAAAAAAPPPDTATQPDLPAPAVPEAATIPAAAPVEAPAATVQPDPAPAAMPLPVAGPAPIRSDQLAAPPPPRRVVVKPKQTRQQTVRRERAGNGGGAGGGDMMRLGRQPAARPVEVPAPRRAPSGDWTRSVFQP